MPLGMDDGVSDDERPRYECCEHCDPSDDCCDDHVSPCPYGCDDDEG